MSRQGAVCCDLPGRDRWCLDPGGRPPDQSPFGNESGISKSTVSRTCTEIEEAVAGLLGGSLDHTWFSYLFPGRHLP